MTTTMAQASNARLVLITGASSGIGRATALLLDAQGYTVLAGVRREEDGAALRAEASSRLSTIILDVTLPDHITAAHEAVVRLGGGRGLHALVNNAGYNYNAAFEYSDETRARAMMEVNFFGLYKLSQAMIPLLRLSATKSGETAKLVNLGSIGNVVGFPWEAFYHASKFALLGLSQSLHHELYAQNIRVTVVQPGVIRTPFIAKTQSSIAEAVAAMPGEGVALYGKGLKKLSEMAASSGRLGSSPEAVARAIVRVVSAANPPFRLFVGLDARMMNLMRMILPAGLFHALLRRNFAC
jgi:NAD(P)-dependent dehydrogenase (short-subunit alcohol dehydrogenase family)